MKKKLFAASLLALGITALAGCELEETTIIYDGKEMPLDEAEERIADKLEVDNPDLDLEVDLYEEVDD